jgi:type IV pilus assembly protein PilM
MATNLKTGRPHLACEITHDYVVVARATQDGASLDAYTARPLANGSLAPRLTEDNVCNITLVKQALSDAFTTVGARSKDIVAILPDACARIALLEFETLPEKKLEAEGVIRFRLKKTMPFDIDKASVSYDVIRAEGKVRVLAAVVMNSVLTEYETMFRDLGFAPGVVIPSSLAALGNVDTVDPVMVIKSDPNTTTLAIVGNQQLLLFRTLENPGGVTPTAEQLVEDVHASLIFFQDTYNMQVNKILIGGAVDAEQIAPFLESQTNVRVQNLVAAHNLGSAQRDFPASALAGVVGALLG